MTNPGDDDSWDRLADFSCRTFNGISGHASATVDGSLTLISVRVDGPFHDQTSACIRKAINYALITARESLARYLASDAGLDLPSPLRAVLDGASAPEADPDSLPLDYEAEKSGILVKIDGRKCVVTWVDVPSAMHLPLLPEIVNAAVHAAEIGRSSPQLTVTNEHDWEQIVKHLADVQYQFAAIVSAHEDQEHGTLHPPRTEGE